MALFSGTKGGMPENSTYVYSPMELPEDNSLGMLMSMLYAGNKREASSSTKSSKSTEEGLRKVPALKASGNYFVEMRNSLQQQKNALVNKTKPLFEKYGSNPKAFLNSKEGREFQMKATQLSLLERDMDKSIPNLTQELRQWQTSWGIMEKEKEGNRIALDRNYNPMGTQYGGGKVQIGLNGYIPTTEEYLQYMDDTPGGYDKEGYKARPVPVITGDNGAWEEFLSKQGTIAQASMNEGAGRNVAMTGEGAGVLLDDNGNPTNDPKAASIGSTYNYLRTSKVGGNSQAVNTILKEYQDKMPTKARSDLMKQFWEDVRSGRLNEDLMIDKNGNVVEKNGDFVYTDDQRQAIKDIRAGGDDVNYGAIESVKNTYTHLRVLKDLNLYRKSTYDPYFHFFNAGTPGDYKEKYPEASWQQTIADPAVITTNNAPVAGKLIISAPGGNGYEAKNVTMWNQDVPTMLRELFRKKYFISNDGVPTVDLMSQMTSGVILPDGTIMEPTAFTELNAEGGLALPILDMVGTSAMPKIKRDKKTGFLTRQLLPWTSKNGQQAADVESFITYNIFVEDLDKIPAIRPVGGGTKGTYTWEGDESNNEKYWLQQGNKVVPITTWRYDKRGKPEQVSGYSMEVKVPVPTSQSLKGTSESTFNNAVGNTQFTNFTVEDYINNVKQAMGVRASMGNNQIPQ